MPPDVTIHDDLAGNDQAGNGGQTDATDWKAKYVGLQGKILGIQTQLVDAQSALSAERAAWNSEREQITGQASLLQASLEAAQAQLTDLSTKWEGANAQKETLAQQVERQNVMLKHPGLISDPIMKLVQSSTMSAADLEEALGALSQGQKQIVTQAFQEAQSGATQPVGAGAAGTGSTKQELKAAAWQASVSAMQKGDMATYRTEYAKYLALADESGNKLATPAVLSSNPI
jgi:chromosome segregation ATPase